MRPPRFHVRAMMFLVWLSAWLIAGAVDVFKGWRDPRECAMMITDYADGSSSVTLIPASYHLGPVPLGPHPMTVFGGLVVAASIAIWVAMHLRRS